MKDHQTSNGLIHPDFSVWGQTELALASLPFLRSAPTGRLKAEHVEIILKHLLVTDQARVLGIFFFNDSGSQLKQICVGMQ